jgi:hypothetical protein
VIVVTALQPPVLIQTLSVEEYKAQDCPVVSLVNLLRDMSEVHGEDLIASDLVLLFL